MPDDPFSMDSDAPRIDLLQDVCHEHDATLLIDVAHDLGALGTDGTGQLGIQQMLGKVDLVMGTFSKTFSSNGGFLASNSESALQFVRAFASPWMFSNALSPIQIAVIRQALQVVRSDEGEQLRRRLRYNADTLRDALTDEGLRCLGSPSAIVPVHIGDEQTARTASSLLHTNGVHINLAEYPGVPRNAARFRMQVMATHTEQTNPARRPHCGASDQRRLLARGL